MTKIAYQYEYQTDVKDIEFTPYKRKRSVGIDGAMWTLAARQVRATEKRFARRETTPLALENRNIPACEMTSLALENRNVPFVCLCL